MFQGRNYIKSGVREETAKVTINPVLAVIPAPLCNLTQLKLAVHMHSVKGFSEIKTQRLTSGKWEQGVMSGVMEEIKTWAKE